MKSGLRKLCDIYGPPRDPVRLELINSLLNAGIMFDTHHASRKRDGAEGIRFCVKSADLAAARALLPLKLRGFRAVNEGG